MGRILTEQELQLETRAFVGTGGTSANSRSSGFLPAFLDTCTQAVYLSRYCDGRPAPFHLIDGLPDAVVLSRSASGKVEAVKPGVVSGFVLDGQFYSREESAKRVADRR
ncbi:MAG: hypothetical protein H6R15_1584 [Proteobacteria bacterium]|nr:hypothetical protein [Pseudomonadota bacterium]